MDIEQLMSAIFGLASATSGVILSSYLNVPAGPLVVIAGAAIFVAGVAVSSLSKRLKTTVFVTQIHESESSLYTGMMKDGNKKFPVSRPDLNTLNHNCLAACDAAILTGSQTGEAGGT